MVDPILLLTKAMSSKEGQETFKKFGESMGSMKEIANAGGFQDMKSMFDSAQQIMGSPLLQPLQVLASTIAAGTSDATIQLMQTMMEQLEKPGVQNAINAFINLINILLESLGVVLGWIGDIADYLFGGQFGKDMHVDLRDPYQNPKLHADYYSSLGSGTTPGTSTSTVVYFDPNDPSTHASGVF